MKYDVVLEGGGVKIPGLVGAIAALEGHGFEPACIAGTSAGAIVASMLAAGYTSEEMRTLINDVDFNQFKDGASFGRKIPNIMLRNGIYAGDVFYRLMQDFMREKGILTFGDLRDGETLDPNRRSRLKVYATDLTRGNLVTWPDDAKLYGLSPDHLEVAWAVRTSMGIPMFFQPVKLDGSYLVDGGMLSNFPIWQFDTPRAPRFPTFGLNLWEQSAGSPNIITGPISFIEAMVKTSLEAHDKRFIRPDDFHQRVIRIPVGAIKATDFDITMEQKEALFRSGYVAANTFLETWSWEEYRRWACESRGVV